MKLYQNIVASRLVLRRKEKGFTQIEVIALIKEKLQETATVSMSTFSHWETGYRQVPEKYVPVLAEVLDCTEEYLRGISSSPDSSEPDPKDSDDSKELIPYNMLYKYDRQPIFIEWLDYSHENEWGLYDRTTNTVCYIDHKVFLGTVKSSTIKIYSIAPDYSNPNPYGKSVLDLRKVMMYDQVYVRMNTSDRAVQNLYNGLYHHNENRSALINDSGLVLSYSGCNLSYVCYSIGGMDPNEIYYTNRRKQKEEIKENTDN